MKTGTTHIKNVLDEFDFKHYSIVNGEKKLVVGDKIVQQHECGLFNGHENYKLLATIRNPYSRTFSNYSAEDKNVSLSDFKKYLEEYYQLTHDFDICAKIIRIPDYIVRVENMYDDYSKIPFIVNSEIFKSGRLKKMVNEKINSNPMEYNWKEFYDQDAADMVYYSNIKYFEQYEYEKDSWKN